MNLKENYERLFGKLPETDKLGKKLSENKQSTKKTLTESEALRFQNIEKSFRQQFPKKALRIKEGFVCVDNLIVEKVDTFIKKNNSQIITTLKSFVNK